MRADVTISGGATYSIAQIADGLTNRRPLNAALGKRGEGELRAHFLERNQEPNKTGFPRQDFWNRIRKATSLASIDEAGATIAIGDPAIAQKVYGGEIKPKEGKYLTLPAIAEASGRSSRTFQNLEPLVRWINGSARAIALVERKATQLVREKGVARKGAEVGGKVFFWLVESVNQKRDPRALPSREKMEEALGEEAGFFIQGIAR